MRRLETGVWTKFEGLAPKGLIWWFSIRSCLSPGLAVSWLVFGLLCSLTPTSTAYRHVSVPSYLFSYCIWISLGNIFLDIIPQVNDIYNCSSSQQYDIRNTIYNFHAYQCIILFSGNEWLVILFDKLVILNNVNLLLMFKKIYRKKKRRGSFVNENIKEDKLIKKKKGIYEKKNSKEVY